MADKAPDKSLETANSEAILALSQTMTRLVDGMDNSRVQQIPISKARIPTPWNPEGKKNHERAKLTRNTYQNGARVVAERLTEEEIRAFNKLKPGRYGKDRKWVVVKRADDSIELRYPNKTIEERMELGKVAVDGIISILTIINGEFEERKALRKKGIIPEDEVMDS